MDAFGVSLNIMSLGGLALGVGMLVDNSIIVLENIFRHREEGAEAPWSGGGRGAEEVAGAITASTLTTIAVFGPIIYVEGVAGELFRDLSLAVAFSLLASLLVALTLLPPGGPLPGGPGPRPRGPAPDRGPDRREPWRRGVAPSAGPSGPRMAPPLGRGVADSSSGFWGGGIRRAGGRLFGPPLGPSTGASTASPGATTGPGVGPGSPGRGPHPGGAGLAGALLGAATLDRDLLPRVDQGAFEVRVELPEGTTLSGTDQVARLLEEVLLGTTGWRRCSGRWGGTCGASPRDDPRGSTPPASRCAFGGGATDRPGAPPGAPGGRGPRGGGDRERRAGHGPGEILGGAEADIAVGSGERTWTPPSPTPTGWWTALAGVERSPTCAGGDRSGVSPSSRWRSSGGGGPVRDPGPAVAETVEQGMRGTRHGVRGLRPEDPRPGPVPRRPPLRRETLETLRVEGVPLRSSSGPGSPGARRDPEGGAGAGRLRPGRRAGGAGWTGPSTTVEEDPGRHPPRWGLRVEVGGENEEMRRSFRDLSFAFGLALILVYMILAAQFESFVHPGTILASPSPWPSSGRSWPSPHRRGAQHHVLIGMVILVGIVVNDAIVKVDFIVQARARGAALREAITGGGPGPAPAHRHDHRHHRPGAHPHGPGDRAGADLRAPLAIAVIGGLLVATLLTLLVVPVVFSLVEETRMKPGPGRGRPRRLRRGPRRGRDPRGGGGDGPGPGPGRGAR
jgi:hydrophobic/amphiphilic exporter-1 (mainly G- bacteria), HAE1 family